MRLALFYTIGLLLLLAPSLHAQYVLKGYLGVEGGESFHYDMHFSDSSGTITGVAYTYSILGKEVKTRIKGTTDKIRQTIQFQETEILYNKGFHSNATICLIKATLQYKNIGEESPSLSGGISSSDITQVTCSNGSITIQNASDAATLFNTTIIPVVKTTVTNPVKSKKPIKVVYDTSTVFNNEAAANTSSTTVIVKVTNGGEKSISWKSDSLTILIWDGGKVDGDIISLFINDENVLHRYTLSKVQKIMTFAQLKKETIIQIKAENEGSEPPNTADILLLDGSREHRLISYNPQGKNATIRLIRNLE